MYQVVFSDVDGTLLNDQHCITPLTLLAIKKFNNKEYLLLLYLHVVPQESIQF